MDTPAQLPIGLPDLPGIEPGWELLALDEPATRARFTAEQLDAQAGKRDAILRALAEGMGVRAIARAYEVSTNTVLAASRRFGGEIETLKEQLGRGCFDVARLAVERMRDEIDDMPKASLPIIAGVMIDKGQLLTGAPTMRVQHDHSVSVASVADFIDALPVAAPVNAGGEVAQKALEGGSSGVDLDAAAGSGELDAEAIRDSQSLLSAQSQEAGAADKSDIGRIEPKKEAAS